MSGYIGTQSVALSTVGGDIGGNVEVGGTLVVNSNLGIGTTTPDSKLDIDTGSASATALTIQAQGITAARLQAGLGLFSAGFPAVIGTANGLDLGTSASAPVRFFTTSAERMNISAAGQVNVIGTLDAQILSANVIASVSSNSVYAVGSSASVTATSTTEGRMYHVTAMRTQGSTNVTSAFATITYASAARALTVINTGTGINITESAGLISATNTGTIATMYISVTRVR
jgi:hypothetical protein